MFTITFLDYAIRSFFQFDVHAHKFGINKFAEPNVVIGQVVQSFF